MNNFVFFDMVGYIGVYEVVIVGCVVMDKVIGKIYEGCKKNGYIFFIMFDYGNVEEMKFFDGKFKMFYIINKVFFIMVNVFEGWSLKKEEGVFGDVVFIVFVVMGLLIFEEMIGCSLLVRN